MTSEVQLLLKLIQLFQFLINTILVWDLRIDMFPEAENKEYILIGKVSKKAMGTPLQYSCLENPLDREAW